MKTLKHVWLIICVSLLVLMTGAVAGSVIAQGYSFSIPRMNMQAYIQPNSDVRIVYDITFENRGAVIDVVDIGLPHSNYDISNMSASIDDVPLTDIRPSEFIDVGVEIHLEGQAIPSGETATLHFEAVMPDLIYEDTTDRDYASLQLTPTWFDESSVQGASELGIAVHLPEGVTPEEVRYQREPFTDVAIFEDRTVAVWEFESVRLVEPHPIGVSFPKDAVTDVIEMSFIDLVAEWLADNPQVRFILGTISVILFAILFFRFSGGTGCSVFGFLTAGMILLFAIMPFSVLFAIPVLVVLIIVNEVWLKKKPKDYLPPIAQVEGGGIKRGLTAPEAAVLLELPLNKVLTLVIFGLLEKGVLEMVKEDPLTVKVKDPFAAWDDPANRDDIERRRTLRRAAARDAGGVLHGYEDYFLDQIERNPGKPVAEINFTQPMNELIRTTVDKMEGFDLSDTQDYYKRIISRAMEQANSIGEIEQREQYLDKYLPWVMMNENYPTVLTRGGYNYWPWWARGTVLPRTTGGVSRGGGPRVAPSRGQVSRAGGRTTLSDVAGSFAGWTETTMGGLAAAILPQSLSASRPAEGGVINLGGADRVTGDIFEALSKASRSSGRGGGRSGGGGRSCACACAGCACACACAGGGR